jgi:hypothetical protein
MASYPSVKTDRVYYDKSDNYADQNIKLTLLDGSILEIWGDVYYNGVLLGTGGGGGLSGITIKEDGTLRGGGFVALNFSNGLDISGGPSEALIVVDLGEYTGTALPNTMVAGLDALIDGRVAKIGDVMTGGLSINNASPIFTLNNAAGTFAGNFGAVPGSHVYLNAPSSRSVELMINGSSKLSVTNTSVAVPVPLSLPADPTNPLEASTKQYVDTNFQTKDTDLTTIAALTATTDNFMQSKASAWASRTPAQVVADLPLFTTAVRGLVPPTVSSTGKFLKDDATWGTPAGGGGLSAASNAETIAGTLSTVAVTPASLEYERPYLDVRTYGAVGDGTTNDTAAFQAAVTALPSTGGIIYVPDGTYVVQGLTLKNGVSIRGNGFSSKLLTKSGDMISITTAIQNINLNDLYLESSTSGGHIINVSGTGALYLSKFENVQFGQFINGKSVLIVRGGMIDTLFLRCDSQHTLTATVPTFDLVTVTNDLACNTWQRCRFTNTGNYAIWLENAGSDGSYCYDNTISDCNFEVCNGGAVKLLSCMNTLLSQCANHDLTTTTKDLFYIGKSPTGVGLPSRLNTLIHVSRRGGTLGGGLYDLKLQSAGAQQCTVINCNTSSFPSVGLVRDYGLNEVTDIGNGPVSAINADWTTFLQGSTLRTGQGATGTGYTGAQAGLGAQWFDTTLNKVVWSDGTNWIAPATTTELAAKQPLDTDLTTIAGLTATTDNFMQAKSSAWSSRTPAQVTADLSVFGATSRGLVPSPAGATGKFLRDDTWRTPTQVTADLIPMAGDAGSGGTQGLVPAPITGDSVKFLKGDGTWSSPASVLSGVGGVFPFTFNTTTTEPPTGNQLRGNNATFASSTKLWIMETTTDGLDVTIGLSRIKAGFQIYIQNYNNAAQYAIWNVTADATDKGAYWEITVAPSSSAGTIPSGKIALQSLSSAQANNLFSTTTTAAGLAPGSNGATTNFLRGDGTWQAIAGGGNALTSNPLSQFAATTSLQLLGVMSDETGTGALVFATNPVLVTPNLGTPSAVNLTNGTALPVGGITASTTLPLGVGTVELGHATDTTLSRSSAGVLAVESIAVPTVSSTDTLTNKTLTDPKINLAINAQTGTTYTLVLTDNGKLLTHSNASAITVSVPTNASVAFPVGTQITLAQIGAGKVTVAAVTPGTTTVNGTPSLGFRAQYSAATLLKTATDVWLLVGDLA